MKKNIFSLDRSSGAYSAMDDVSKYLNDEILALLRELPSDPSRLAEFGALLFALVCLSEQTSGYIRPSFDVPKVRDKIFEINRTHVAEFSDDFSSAELAKRVQFFEDLFRRANTASSER